eukprot:1174875-Rhodomonas_salina.1
MAAASCAGGATLSFDEMMEKDSADSTTRGYKSLANHFVQFLKHWNPAVVSDEGSRLCGQ